METVADETVMLPSGVAERVHAIEHEPTRYLIAKILAECLDENRDAVAVSYHSKLVCRILADRHYKGYLLQMQSFGDVVSRDTSYLPRSISQSKPAKCMSWRRSKNKQIAVRVPVCIPGWFLARVAKAGAWFWEVYLPKVFPDMAMGSSLVGHYNKCLEVPEVSEMEADSLKDSVEKADELLEKIEKLRQNGCSDRVTFDRGDRMYHDLTTIPKAIRTRCTWNGEELVEVDMHASFVAAIAHLYARGEERDRMIAMLQTGDFYGEFARLAGCDRGRVKERFLRDAVFSYKRGGNLLWSAFKRLFPFTAKRISWDRDWGVVVKTEQKTKIVKGREVKFTCKTREGQVFLSRRLSMIESRIFWRGALMNLFHKHRLPAIPIHDCLLVRKKDAPIALEEVLQSAESVLGFRPVVKVTNCFGERLA